MTWVGLSAPQLTYLVRVEPAGVTVDTLDAEANFLQLPTAAPQTFFVRARSAFGLGAEAASNTVVLADVPGAPSGLQAAPAAESAYLTWNPAENGGAPILGYELTAQTGATSTVPGTQSAGRVQGLAVGQSHAISVRARNIAGTGAAATVQVTPRCVRGFMNPPLAEVIARPTSSGVVDINGDGVLDVWATEAARGVVFVQFTNRGSVARLDALGSADMRGPAFADFDEDGTLDVATGGRHVDVHLARGGVSRFTSQRLVTATTAPSVTPPTYVAAAELSGDHHIDLFSSNGSRSRLFLGRGDGTFEETSIPSTIKVDITGDFDGDGIASVANRAGNQVNLFDFRDGGVIEQQLVFSRPPYGVRATDVEHDGDDELLICFANDTEVWRSVSGTLQHWQTLANSFCHFEQDVTGDGFVDLVDFFGRAATNNGQGLFSGATSLGLHGFHTVVGFADVDFDGAPDALVMLEDGVGVDLARFRSRTPLPGEFANHASPTGFALADFDGDGRPDLIEAASLVSNAQNLALRLGLDRDGGWSSVVTIPTPPHTYDRWLETGDFNGDGRPDLVFSTDPDHGAGVFMNDAGALSLSLPLDSDRGVVGDFDGDGIDDLYETGTLRRGRPEGLAAPISVGGPAVDAQTMVAGAQLFGDAAEELIGTGGVWSLIDGGFRHTSNLQITKVADLNGDGLPDGVYLGGGSGAALGKPDVWLQRPDGGFELRLAVVPPFPPLHPHQLHEGGFGDLDADGDLDFVATDIYADATVLVFWNDGEGRFATYNRYRSGYGRTNIATVDLDHDGAAEFIAGARLGLPVFHPNVCVE
ncbi:MAG: VCBS repeat-containing protein [Myxococcaceae bacterium]|nr:VCBS repeat-containing protein [Myxococcaceae bacterium]